MILSHWQTPRMKFCHWKSKQLNSAQLNHFRKQTIHHKYLIESVNVPKIWYLVFWKILWMMKVTSVNPWIFKFFSPFFTKGCLKSVVVVCVFRLCIRCSCDSINDNTINRWPNLKVINNWFLIAKDKVTYFLMIGYDLLFWKTFWKIGVNDTRKYKFRVIIKITNW